MSDLIWIFQSITHGGLIARRDPHYYQYTMDLQTGEDIMILSGGTPITCPLWESVRITDGRRYGMTGGQTYDITDLVLTATGTTTSTATATSG